jgi:hypothetical protein
MIQTYEEWVSNDQTTEYSREIGHTIITLRPVCKEIFTTHQTKFVSSPVFYYPGSNVNECITRKLTLENVTDYYQFLSDNISQFEYVLDIYFAPARLVNPLDNLTFLQDFSTIVKS